MGCGSWTADKWDAYSKENIEEKSATYIYTSNFMSEEFDPKTARIRESCDSSEHPESNAIIIGLDVTGSMHDILETVANKLGLLVGTIYDHKPMTDPQILFCAIGDTFFDIAPFQVTQFESDIRIAEQLTKLYFERGGGPNNFESYPLAWYFAARHTKIDCFEKRGKKGLLFTMGDDCFPEVLTKDEIRDVFGDEIQADIPITELLDEVNRKYEVFHLVLDRAYDTSHIDEWYRLLGQHVIQVRDCEKVPEVIVSIIEMMNGRNHKEVVESWDGSTALVVKEALSDLETLTDQSGVVVFE